MAAVSTTSSPADSSIPVPKDLDDLVRLIRLELGEHGLDAKEVDVARVQQLMANYTSCRTDWEKYALFDKYRYTRNLVDDGNGNFNLIVLAWGAQHQSAIHNHSGSHCVMKLLDGELLEEQFDAPATDSPSADQAIAEHTDHAMSSHEGEPLMAIKSEVYGRDAVTYISDNIGLHRVGNPSRVRGAVSLHLYTPPIKVYRTYCEGTGQARAGGSATFYSIRGERASHRPRE